MIIYKITNKINGKIYVGQTVRTIQQRFNQHNKKSGCRALSSALKKYGKENFVVEKIDSALNRQELNEKETYWIETLNSFYPKGYNLNKGGDSREWSSISKKRMSKSHKGKALSPEHKKKIGLGVNAAFKENPDLIKNNSEKISKGLKGYYLINKHPKKDKKLSLDSKRKISEAKRGSKNPMFGKKSNKKQLDALAKGQEKRRLSHPMIKCHQNGKIYSRISDAATDLGFARSSISNVLIGHRKNCGGFTFEYIKRTSNEL